MPANPSRTALATAYLRAAHQLIDREPRLLDDPIAVPLLGPEAPARIHAAGDRYGSAEARGLRSHVLLRARFTEDRLQAAVARGVTQYVMLGAGFDTFAYRQPPWASGLRVIEVDSPATQRVKRGLLESAGIATPANVVFADVDLEHETLQAGFARHRLALYQPTFFSWLGVSMYLTPETVDDVLKVIAAFPIGSEVVLTFAWPPGDPHVTQGTSTLAERAAKAGEPWLTFFLPADLEAKLHDIGFSQVTFLSPTAAQEQYFSGRPDDLPAPRLATIVAAIR